MGRIKIKYPAKEHLAQIAKHLPEPLHTHFILLHGAKYIPRGRSDQAYTFDQEANFYYCSGASSPGWILLYEIHRHELTFFIPPLRQGRDIAYLGQLESREDVLRAYDVDHVFYHNHLGRALIDAGTGAFYTLDNADLIKALIAARSIKDHIEITRVKEANAISSAAHRVVATRISKYKNEKEAEADFIRTCTLHHASSQAYGPIFGSGMNASVLHYMANDANFNDSELLLVDAACEYRRYAADVTRTYPISGKFSKRGRRLYNTVLEMQKSCIERVKAGVSMATLQEYAHKVLSQLMVDEKLVNCDLETCIEKNLSGAFMMHGLGHHIGLDVHDIAPQDSTMIGLKVPTITAVTPLEVGNIVTIEPGIYFNEEFLSNYYKDDKIAHYFNKDEIKTWIPLGGVRIEDCILVTSNGYENLTTMVKEITEIEELCSQTY